jgi:acyl carrier protein
MTSDEALERLTALIRHHIDEPDTPVTAKSNLQDDLGMDSLKQVDLVIEIEREFGIVVDDSEMVQWRDLDAIINSIVSR